MGQSSILYQSIILSVMRQMSRRANLQGLYLLNNTSRPLPFDLNLSPPLPLPLSLSHTHTRTRIKKRMRHFTEHKSYAKPVNKLQRMRPWSWRESLLDKSMHCSYRGPEYNSLHPHHVAHTTLRSICRGLSPLASQDSVLPYTQRHTCT